ncbi:Allergen Asp f 7 [Leucoagaricus sp. SymC.cos]|nr:Allergen Asp f 7 [Leucoagaricus sp. SymC.cos]
MDHGLHKLEEEVHAMMKMHRTAANSTSSSPASVPVATAHATYAEWHQALADHVLPHERRHHSTSKRAKSRMTHVQPVKRDGSVLTWFLPGAGACGGHNGPNDYVGVVIIAISHLIWNGGAHCGDTVTISYHGKTAQATIVDECMGCESGHIDLSPGLLHYLAGPGTDMVTDANWSFGVPEPTPPKPKPTPTYTPTTKAEPAPSSTSSTKTTTTSTYSSASSSVVSSTASYTSASASAVPPSYVDDGTVHNIEDIQVLLVSFGNMVVSGASAKA